MKALQFNVTIPRYAAGIVLRRLSARLLWSGLSCTYESEVPVPLLPTPEWVRIHTRLGGICGSDLATIYLQPSFYYVPYSSFPFTLGHEAMGVIGEIGSQVRGWEAGERVVVEPTLWCVPRGIEPMCEACRRGEINRCARRTQGVVAAGWGIGNCRDTGGSWGPSFVAHASQLYRVPPEVSDANALMVEPFAVGLHAALRSFPEDGETALIIGAGTIGLVTLAALRALGSKARLLVIARHPFQAEAAHRLGASEVFVRTDQSDPFRFIATQTGADIMKPILAERVVDGGVDRTFECVGTDKTLDQALRFTRKGGHVVLVGVPGIAHGVDWTSVFDQELEVLGSFIYHHAERYEDKKWKTFDLALRLLSEGRVDLSWLVTHRFSQPEWRQALTMHQDRSSHGIIKAVFEFPLQRP